MLPSPSPRYPGRLQGRPSPVKRRLPPSLPGARALTTVSPGLVGGDHISAAAGARLYHLVPAAMRGAELFPLSRLAIDAPDLHAAAVRKYTGREWLPEKAIPPLGCRWRDVVFLSALSPRVIFAELARLGRRGPVPRWFAIPLDRVRGWPAVVYDPPGRLASTKALADAFAAFDPDTFRELAEVPRSTRIHFAASRRLQRRPFLFHRVPHVLVRAPIDVTDVPIETLDAPPSTAA